MSLQGSLDTFALPDVLVLLASTTKSGELYVAGHRSAGGGVAQLQGRLWFDAGRIVGNDVLESSEPADALFELLRLAEGTFSFAPGSAPDPGAPYEVEPVLTEALARLAEWREIEKVVPSLSAWLELAPEIPNGHVTLRSDQWRLAVAVAGGRTVDSVLRHLELAELPGCRAVKDMVEAGLVSLRSDQHAPLATEEWQPSVQERASWADLPTGQPESAAVSEQAEDDATPTVESQLPSVEGEAPPWRSELAEIPDLDALVTIPPRRRRRTELTEPAEPAEPAADAPVADAQPEVAEVAPAPVATAAELPEGMGDDLEDGDEPLNRGLLLKFLSSVRN